MKDAAWEEFVNDIAVRIDRFIKDFDAQEVEDGLKELEKVYATATTQEQKTALAYCIQELSARQSDQQLSRQKGE